MTKMKSKKAFQLLVRQREFRAIYELFSQVSRFDEAKKRQWLKENSELVTDAFLSFLEMNQTEVDILGLKGESKEISLEILDLLDKTTEVMESALDPRGKLEA